MLHGILIATLTIGLWILVQILISVLRKAENKRLPIFKLYFLSLGFYLLLQIILPNSLPRELRILDFFNGFLLHILLFYMLIQPYSAVDHAVTLRILDGFFRNPQMTTMAMGDIQRQYSLEWMIERRLNWLVGKGYLFQERDFFFLTRKGRGFAKFFSWGSKLYGKR